MFHGDDVIWFMRQYYIIFMNKAVLAELAGSLANLPTQMKRDILAHRGGRSLF